MASLFVLSSLYSGTVVIRSHLLANEAGELPIMAWCVLAYLFLQAKHQKL